MEHYDVDCLIIGAGVIGLAIARRMALEGREVLVLERESCIGSQTSSRNSEVIHAGIYYPKDSLKAALCTLGKSLLYEYCGHFDVPFNRCGKLIVATNEGQLATLSNIREQAIKNGVEDIEFLTEDKLSSREPNVSGIAALFSPSTGVFDCHTYMLQLQADIEANGGQCIFNSEVEIARQLNGGVELILNRGEALISTKCCVNSAGLGSLGLIQEFYACRDLKVPVQYAQAHFAKGSYFSYSGSVPFEHLIYPVPEPGGLGIHLTLDLQGRARFGPDVEWLKTTKLQDLDYRVNPQKKEAFFQAVEQYWPQVELSKMQPDYAGVRPKLAGPDEGARDFLIQGPKDHGIDGLINLAGIESPGLTSSLAIAEYVLSIAKSSNM